MEHENWTYNKDEMKRVALNYFNNLFAHNSILGEYIELPLLFRKINEVSVEEVKMSLDGIGRLKAPRPDGLPTLFFQKSWNLCKDEIYKMVVESFRDGKVSESINQTLITLIPKIPSHLDMTYLRPISLCNTTYKIISKVIVSRLR
ncbi:hypothetical protein ACOSQ2_010689 [Xanthoceras sorbifolium]